MSEDEVQLMYDRVCPVRYGQTSYCLVRTDLQHALEGQFVGRIYRDMIELPSYPISMFVVGRHNTLDMILVNSNTQQVLSVTNWRCQSNILEYVELLSLILNQAQILRLCQTNLAFLPARFFSVVMAESRSCGCDEYALYRRGEWDDVHLLTLRYFGESHPNASEEQLTEWDKVLQIAEPVYNILHDKIEMERQRTVCERILFVVEGPTPQLHPASHWHDVVIWTANIGREL